MPSMLSATLLAALLPSSTDASSAACEDHDVVALMSSVQGSGTRFRSGERAAANAAATQDAVKPLDVGWFGGAFAESESTFSQDGVSAHLDLNPEKLVMNGRDPVTRVPARLPSVRSSHFFHESPSAGGFDAWQTDHSSDRSVVGSDRRANSNDWRATPEGWTQDYAPTVRKNAPGPKTAGWFDASVSQYDGFGRPKVPEAGTGARLMGSGSWRERSVNTTLTCANPGCQAVSTLQAFDGATEMGSNCKLTIYVHPTDFDDDYGAEAVEFLKANGYVLTHNCNPGARGCNSTAANPYYSCTNAVDVDGLMDSTGALVIEGKITDRVDECPINGNLLHGVAMVTCMVSPITTTTTTTTTVPTEFVVRGIDNASAPIACNTPGCVGTAELFFNPYYAEHGGLCTLSLTVAQTDFDQNNGVTEVIEYIKVEGEDVATNVEPGMNPCVAEYESGSPIAPEDRIFTALTQTDVTAQVLAATFRGRLQITGKISEYVDECGTSPDGNLLDGLLFLECAPSDAASAAASGR